MAAEAADGGRARPRVLVVDDEAPIRSSLQRLLLFEDCEVVCAGSGEEALVRMGEAPCEVVVTDQHMPGMQGVDLLRAVRDRWPEASRILFSGHVDIELLREAVNGGEVYRFITKPWDDDELRLAVRHAAERAALMHHNRALQERNRRQNEELRRFNASLSDMVQARTLDLEQRNQALLLNQDILDQLPVAVIGIDPEGMLVMANELARSFFPGATPGLGIGEGLPAAVATWIASLSGGDTAPLHYAHQQGELQLEAVSLDERGTVISAVPLARILAGPDSGLLRAPDA